MKYSNKIEMINIEKLIPYKNNSRKHNKSQLEKIRSSFKEFGFINPILIDNNNNIIAGHGRLEAAKMEKISDVPCVRIDYLTEEQKRAYIIADNKLAEDAEWDEEILKQELEELDKINFDIDLTGFDKEFLNSLKDNTKDELDNVKEDNFDLEKEQPSVTKKGDIIKLGNNILMCGDSFTDDIQKLMMGRKADLGFCDPPYDMDKDDWVNNLNNVKEGSPILVMAGDKQTIRIANKIPNFRQFIVHDREQAMLVNTSTPMSQHTIISLFCDHPKKYYVNLNDHFTSIIKCKKDYKKAKDEFSCKMGKPIKLIAELISHYSKKEDIILDMFGGGGSTLIACEQLNRICYTNELDPVQCDKIVARWETFTGRKHEIII